MSVTRLRLGILAFCGASALSVSAMVAGLGIPGCTVLTNDALPDDAGKFEGGGDASSTACTSCVAVECTAPWAVCLTDSRCVALRGCSTPFSESAAGRQKCFCDTADASATTEDAGVADPLAAYAAFASCNDARTCARCASDCTSSCSSGGTKTTAGSCSTDDAGTDTDGGVADAATDDGGDAGDAGVPDATTSETASVDGCAACVSDKCDAAKKACALGSECSAFLACAYGCVDAACVDACGKSFSTGKASATELSSCTLTSCRSACGL
jgi:hypothetical protein